MGKVTQKRLIAAIRLAVLSTMPVDIVEGEPIQCRHCYEVMHIDYDLSPAPICNLCAQSISEDLSEIILDIFARRNPVTDNVIAAMFPKKAKKAKKAKRKHVC